MNETTLKGLHILVALGKRDRRADGICAQLEGEGATVQRIEVANGGFVEQVFTTLHHSHEDETSPPIDVLVCTERQHCALDGAALSPNGDGQLFAIPGITSIADDETPDRVVEKVAGLLGLISSQGAPQEAGAPAH